jgi:hypothetical protein
MTVSTYRQGEGVYVSGLNNVPLAAKPKYETRQVEFSCILPRQKYLQISPPYVGKYDIMVNIRQVIVMKTHTVRTSIAREGG